MNQDISVFYEATPNPHSLKFMITKIISEESVNFTSAQEAARSPLAQKIFGFPWAVGVFIGPNFVTISKQDWVDWEILAEPLAELIKEHLELGEPVMYLSAREDDQDIDDENDAPIVRQIKTILRNEIRPAVAMDGGDIVFDRYEDGRVFLHMQGACSGCPSSAYTLKEGIETRLRSEIPEITEVVQV
jgi:Fe-S cluster biogenesis protein NfuA